MLNVEGLNIQKADKDNKRVDERDVVEVAFVEIIRNSIWSRWEIKFRHLLKVKRQKCWWLWNVISGRSRSLFIQLLISFTAGNVFEGFIFHRWMWKVELLRRMLIWKNLPLKKTLNTRLFSVPCICLPAPPTLSQIPKQWKINWQEISTDS